MQYHRAIYTLTNRVHNDLADIREVVKMTEAHLHRERVRLASHVKKELRGMSHEEKEYTKGWYMNDFARLDKAYPNIQRRALFTTLMCITEANLLLACNMCHRAFELQKGFKTKGRKRVIEQALCYLRDNLSIRSRWLTPHWEVLQNLWSIRNALVHNDGQPRPSDLKSISDFCAPIPTIDLDHHNRIILHKGSVEMALHAVALFFSRLLAEIKRNKLPNTLIKATGL